VLQRLRSVVRLEDEVTGLRQREGDELAQVGVIIGNLERDGAIQKTPHPVHGRVLQWTLTRRGSDLLDQCRRRVATVERRLMTGLSAKAEVTIRRWLSKIAADLHRDD